MIGPVVLEILFVLKLLYLLEISMSIKIPIKRKTFEIKFNYEIIKLNYEMLKDI